MKRSVDTGHSTGTQIVTTVKVLGGEHPRRGVGITQGLWEMLERCWVSQPSKRPSIEDVLQCLDMRSSLPVPTPPELHPGSEEMKRLPNIILKLGSVDGIMQLPPVFHPHGTIFPYVGSSIPEHARPPRDSPTIYHDQTGGYPMNSGETSNRDYGFCEAMSPRSSDLNRACTPYTVVAGPYPPWDDTAWASPTAAREASQSSGTVDPSVSGLHGGTEDETAGPPTESPPPGINNVESRNPKKRKRPEVEELPRRVKYGREGTPQHHVLQRRSIQVFISKFKPS